jgi:predicted Ser/Thr protein kinase
MRCASCDAELTPAARFCASCAAPVPQPAADPTDTLRVALEGALGFQYRVERLLGRGGMGAVYLANELALDREVAIKVLPPDRAEAEGEGKARFRREARTAARLSHPNIVPLITFGEVQGIAYYVMGYVRGESLAARMKREGRMEPETVARLLGDVAEGLAYAHRQGVVHRDIKPDNILIDEDTGRALLTDFGIARAAGGQTLTSTGAIVGTPRYMSPEQAAGRPDVDGRSDVYSLGLLGYEMLCGDSPFDGKTPSDQLVQRLTRDPRPLASRAPDVPRWLEQAVSKCLARDPAQRWGDARALQKQLRSGNADEDLPVSLATVNGLGQIAALSWLLALGYWQWGTATGQPRVLRLLHPKDGTLDPDPKVTALMFLTALVALGGVEARAKGYDWCAVLRALLRQPTWWPGWYPRWGRAPGDVWDRLPAYLRWTRGLFAMALGIPLVVWLSMAISATNVETYGETGRWPPPRGVGRVLAAEFWRTRDGVLLVDVGSFGLVGVLVAVAYVAIRKLKAGPLGALTDNDEVSVVFFRSTANRRFWSRDPYAALLAPVERLPGSTAILPPTAAVAEDDVTKSRAG